MVSPGDNDEQCPEAFICPITSACFVDPVFASDGHTYDRSGITEWFKNKTSSPMTRERMKNQDLTPNLQLKSMISAWRGEREGEAAIQKGLKDHISKIQWSTTRDELTR